MKSLIERSTPVNLQHLVNRIHQFTKFGEVRR